MPLRADRFALSVGLATPFAEDRSIDLSRLAAHRRNDPIAWSHMRAPQRSLDRAECLKLFAAVDAIRAKRAA